MQQIVGQIVGTNTITFSEDELILEGTGHFKSSHIAVESKGIISLILIDNESALNACPVMILNCIDVGYSLIGPNMMMVRAFDGTKTSTNREIDLKVIIGPCEFEIPFVVVEIHGVFNLLLESPWIHSAGAIPASLHQKVKLYVATNSLA